MDNNITPRPTPFLLSWPLGDKTSQDLKFYTKHAYPFMTVYPDDPLSSSSREDETVPELLEQFFLAANTVAARRSHSSTFQTVQGAITSIVVDPPTPA